MWSSRKASQILLVQLIAVFATSGVIVLGLDDTIERRRGKQIAAKGIYRQGKRILKIENETRKAIYLTKTSFFT